MVHLKSMPVARNHAFRIFNYTEETIWWLPPKGFYYDFYVAIWHLNGNISKKLLKHDVGVENRIQCQIRSV